MTDASIQRLSHIQGNPDKASQEKLLFAGTVFQIHISEIIHFNKSCDENDGIFIKVACSHYRTSPCLQFMPFDCYMAASRKYHKK